MVRVKFRYLVVNFLYPEPPAKSKTQLPDLVQIHSPTPDAFHAGILVRMIRDEVAELYGDYGMGMVSAALKGESKSTIHHSWLLLKPRDSQLLVPLHLNRHNPLSA
jgi:ribonuclease P/MRP protein subunit POP5